MIGQIVKLENPHPYNQKHKGRIGRIYDYSIREWDFFLEFSKDEDVIEVGKEEITDCPFWEGIKYRFGI